MAARINRRLTIAMLVPSIAVSPEFETPTVSLLAEAIAQCANVHVYPIVGGGSYNTVTDTGLTIHPVASGERFSRRAAATIRSLLRDHRRQPFDLIHALWLHEPGTIAVAAGQLLRVPVIASIGGAEVVALPDINYGALRTARGRFMSAHVLQQATFVTGGSEYVIGKARRLVPHRDERRFRRVPLPVDMSAFAPASNRHRTRNACRVLHAASLIPVKDQATLLYAFRRVLDLVPDAILTIAGEDPFGHRTELEALRERLGLGGAVQFVGHRSHAEMPTLYHETDVFVLSSRHESQGMVVLEAAAAGVPTVGTDVGVVRDLAPDAAVSVRPGDPIALGEAIAGVLIDSPRRLRLGERARQRVGSEFDVEPVRDAFVDLYRDAIAMRRR